MNNVIKNYVVKSILLSACFGMISNAIADDYQSLIGKDSLAGWRGDLSSWRVEEGTLIGTADGTLRSNRFIVADIDPVGNFELLAEVWISAGGNSGLQYRSEERPDLGEFVVTGYQCDVVSNNDRYNGMLYEERGRRILSHTGEKVIVDPKGQPWIVGKMPVQHFAPGEWHRFRILVEGNHHRHWIDDVPTADLIDLDEKKRSLAGVLGVQVHVGPKMEIRYRNMKLKRLPDDLPILTVADAAAKIGPDAEKVEPQGGWKAAGVFDMNAKLETAELGDTKNVTRAGDVWLAGQPSREQIRRLPALGIRTVISLRKDGELDWNERELVESLGMTFVELPFRESDELTNDVFEKAMQKLKSASAENGVLLHCASANRVGAVWMVHRVMNGRVAVPQAKEEAARVGLKSPQYEQKALLYLKDRKKL
ncbi:MAG: DUF1080 domain-containing protein [Planctomycetaceae bacterium]|nr:DUF1080 domain-containing protein [Planctomycetaceae bacterium]